MNDVHEDHRLFARIAGGDPRAFRELVDRHSRPLVTYLTRLMKNQFEAEEVAQEVFMRAWQRASDYRPEARATTWLHRIAHNLAIDQLRKRRGFGEADQERDSAPASERPSALLEQKQRALSLSEALDALPLRQKTVMLLKYEQELSNPEIGAVLDLSIDAIESLLARAKRQLKLSLNGEVNHE